MQPRNPIVIAYHLVWTAYGTWLPNDPRGSGSHRVATPLLAELGELHFGRRRLQPSPSTVREFYKRVEPRLLFPIIRFNSQQIDSIGAAFSEVIQRHSYTCYASAIMPDHVHMVIRKHRHRAETMIDNLQSASRLRLGASGDLAPIIPSGPRAAGNAFSIRLPPCRASSATSRRTRQSPVSRPNRGPSSRPTTDGPTELVPPSNPPRWRLGNMQRAL